MHGRIQSVKESSPSDAAKLHQGSTGICGTNAHVPITHCRRTATSAECYHTRTPTPTASSAGRLDSDRIQQSPAQPCLRSGLWIHSPATAELSLAAAPMYVLTDGWSWNRSTGHSAQMPCTRAAARIARVCWCACSCVGQPGGVGAYCVSTASMVACLGTSTARTSSAAWTSSLSPTTDNEGRAKKSESGKV